MSASPQNAKEAFLFILRRRPDSLIHDVRFAIRGLLRQPGFTSAVIVILAVAIGANVAMFSVFHQALIRPLPFAEPERLVMGYATFNGNINPDMSSEDFFDYRKRNEVFESVGAIRTGSKNVTITGGDEPEQVSSVFVSWDFFPTLGIPAAEGRHFTPAEEEPGGPKVVMISGGYWLRQLGGSPEVIGSTVVADGEARTIVGVMPPDFSFLHEVDLWFPMRLDGPAVGSRGWHTWLMVGRLKPDVPIEQAQADVDVISAQLATEFRDTNRDKALLLTALQVAMAEDYQTSVVLLMAAIGFVLLIACGNIASLLLARGAARRTELCVRAALGASSSRIARQLLTESMVTATAAGALGTVFAVLFQRLILYAVPLEVQGIEDLGLSWPMLAFALVVSVATGLLFGLLPAVQASRLDIVSNVRSGARTIDARGQRLHNCLVVAQVAVSVILLIGSGLLLRSLVLLRAVNPGFDTRNLLTAEIRLAPDKYPDEAPRIEFFSILIEELKAIPGVDDVAVINQLPIRNPGGNITVYAAERPPPDPNDRISAYDRIVFPGYFDAMGIPLLSGRGIEASDLAQDAPVLVINETMARTLFPNENPLGRLVNVQQDVDYEVIGVVGDVRVSGPRFRPRLVMYSSYFDQPTLTMRIAIRTAIEPNSLVMEVRNAVWKRDRDIPVAGLTSMEEVIARKVSSEKIVAFAVTLFASVAMLLAALGLYGVLANYVSRRCFEIGVRVALGAEPKDVFILVVQRGLSLIAIGIALGLAGAFWASRLLQQMLFEIAPTDAATFVAVSLIFALVALVACSIPARKALKVNPVNALGVQ